MGHDPDELTLHQAADRLGVHYMTAYRYVRTGKLPARRAGSQWVVDAADLARLEPPAPPGRRPAGAFEVDRGRIRAWRDYFDLGPVLGFFAPS